MKRTLKKLFSGGRGQTEPSAARPRRSQSHEIRSSAQSSTGQSIGQPLESPLEGELDRVLSAAPDEYGIKVLFSPNTPSADIVFVHGLTGGQLSTWTAEGATAPWPKVLLAEDIPQARISAFGYDADVVKFLGQAGQNKIRQHAINLLAGLADMRFDTGIADLPIIFVAHSLGGLVCENALTIAVNADYHQRRILEYTRAIAFLGTPHRGSQLANWATIAGNMVNLLKRTNTRIIETLRPGSEVLEIITQEFHTMLRSRERDIGITISITCYAEELAVSRLGKSFMVVPLPSATLERYPYKTIPSDHINMTKFRERNDSYKRVAIELKRWMKEISEEPARLLDSNPTHGLDQDLLKLLPYASQASFNSYDKRHELTCLPDTRVDILKEIREWANGKGGHIFWLNGLAGTGKSTIARTIAREYYDKRRLGASFFFSRGGGDVSHAGKFFTSIAVQLADKSTFLKRSICEAIAEHSNIASQTLRDQLRQLVLGPLSKLDSNFSPQPLIIVVDALDECDGENDIRAILQLFAEARSLKKVQLRVFLTSRPEIPIRHGLYQIPDAERRDFVLHHISPSIIDHDISIFLEYNFSIIRQNRSLCADWPGDQAIKDLVRRAAGLFIWAATACRFISEGRRFAPERLSLLFESNNSLTEPEKQLNDIYLTVLKNSIGHSYNEQEKKKLYEMLRSTIGTVVILFSPLSAISLARLLRIPKDELDQTLDDLHSVLDIPEDQAELIRLHHPSFRDFLLGKDRCTDPQFWVNEKMAHGALADFCLQLMSEKLRRDICALHSPGTLAMEVKCDVIEMYLPKELQYACLYWVQHIQNSETQLEDDGQVHVFLQKHLLHWLEALSLMRKTSKGVLALISLDSMDADDKGPRLQAFVHDAKRFAVYHRAAIEEAPLQIYYSALIFAPKRSIVRRNFFDQVPTWICRLPEVPSHWSSLLQTLEGHSDSAQAIAFSPNGKLVASASNDRTIKLWDTATGVTVQTLQGHLKSIMAVAFSPNGKLLASASFDKTVKLWDPAAGIVTQTLEGHSSYVWAVAFSPNSMLVASASEDKTIRLWDAAMDIAVQTLKGHSYSVRAVAFSPDGKLVASASEDRTVKLWDVITGAVIQTLEGHSGCVWAIAFSPDSMLIASASKDKTVKLWDLATGAVVQTLQDHSDSVWGVAFSFNGKLIASASGDKTVKLWDAATGTAVQKLEGHSGSVHAVAFSPDGKLIASASDDKTVRLWDAAIGGAVQTLECHSDNVWALALSPDGKVVASASSDNTVKLWNPATGAAIQTLEGHSSWVWDVTFSPDGKLVASASVDTTVKLWDAATGTVQTLKGHLGYVWAIVFSPNGKQVASASDDKTVKLWDPVTGAAVQTLEGHLYSVRAVAFSPDSMLVASASEDRTIKLWNAATGAIVQTFKGHSHSVWAVAFSFNGKLIASASGDKTVKLWDLTAGTAVKTLEGHSGHVRSVVFSPDDKLVASASSDRTVKLWDPATGTAARTLEVNTVVKSLSFSRNGPYLETDRGHLNLQSLTTPVLALQPSSPKYIFVNDNWVAHDTENLLLLPPEYRATCAACLNDILVFGHATGRVTFMEFGLF